MYIYKLIYIDLYIPTYLYIYIYIHPMKNSQSPRIRPGVRSNIPTTKKNHLRIIGSDSNFAKMYYSSLSLIFLILSKTARACSRVTPGNHSRKSDSCAPSSKFWNSAATGTRVPRNTKAPLTR